MGGYEQWGGGGGSGGHSGCRRGAGKEAVTCDALPGGGGVEETDSRVGPDQE